MLKTNAYTIQPHLNIFQDMYLCKNQMMWIMEVLRLTNTSIG